MWKYEESQTTNSTHDTKKFPGFFIRLPLNRGISNNYIKKINFQLLKNESETTRKIKELRSMKLLQKVLIIGINW